MLAGFHREAARRGTSRRSPSTKRIASANGATISARNTAQIAELREHLPGRADDGAHRHRHRARARGHRRASAAARAALLRRELQPARISPIACCRRAQPYEQIAGISSGSGRSESGIIYCASRKAAESVARTPERATAFAAQPYHAGLDAAGARAAPGAVSARRSARDLRDDRLRHGHQQAERPLRHPLRSAEEHRGLLPGNRPRRARRPARRMRAALQRRRRGEADALHRRKDRPAGAAASPASSSSRWCTTPNAPAAGAPTLLRYFGEDLPDDELRRLRQLPLAARDFRRHAGRAEISLLRLSRPRKQRLRRSGSITSSKCSPARTRRRSANGATTSSPPTASGRK